MKIETTDHGRYTLKAMKLPGQKIITARAFHAGGPAGTVAEATGATAQDAFDVLIEQLDSAANAQIANRRHDDDADMDVPTADEFETSIKRFAPKAAHIAMLRAHAASGKDGMTAHELARAANYKDSSSASLHYGKLGYAVAEDLNMTQFVEDFSKNKRAAIIALAAAGEERKGETVWLMYPELVEALDRIV